MEKNDSTEEKRVNHEQSFQTWELQLMQLNTFKRNLKGGRYILEKNKMNRIINSCNLPEACFLFTAVCTAHSVYLLHLEITY